MHGLLLVQRVECRHALDGQIVILCMPLCEQVWLLWIHCRTYPPTPLPDDAAAFGNASIPAGTLQEDQAILSPLSDRVATWTQVGGGLQACDGPQAAASALPACSLALWHLLRRLASLSLHRNTR
jgi:hypothetical protein